MITVKRSHVKLKANPRRVILQYFNLGKESRIINVINRILKLNENETQELISNVNDLFRDRHLNFEDILIKNYDKAAKYIVEPEEVNETKKKLIGAYFSKEYSIESAALFNPSIVIHPNQSGIKNDELRLIMSLRATGEGHISSIEFREVIVDDKLNIRIVEDSKYCSTPTLHPKSGLDENYSLVFSEELSLSERVLFPISKSESMGMEDLRLVRFQEENEICYYGTYTAYDGKSIKSKLMKTEEFKKFEIKSLKGKAANDKGMALFPRKINGKYMMISRQDGENLYIMVSNDLTKWENADILQIPIEPWEFIQLGNCGSPIELDESWLLIAHAVGPLRRYVINAYLLDKENPSIVKARLREPLIEPLEEEREGYVPNVVYSCGQVKKDNVIIIPFAVSDSACGFATVEIPELLDKMYYL